MIRLKRAYEPPAPEDGERYLVDRLWPRGVGREALQLAGWLRELAPSHELRRWFSHDPARWEEFKARYREELASPQKQDLLQELAQKARSGTITLVYSARDDQHNNAVALREMLQQMTEAL